MKNNIKKASVKFWEDLLYIQHFMQILSLPQMNDYHHVNTGGLDKIMFIGCLWVSMMTVLHWSCLPT